MPDARLVVTEDNFQETLPPATRIVDDAGRPTSILTNWTEFLGNFTRRNVVSLGERTSDTEDAIEEITTVTLVDLQAQVDAAEASVLYEATVRAAADAAEATLRLAIDARVGTAESNITSIQTAYAAADAALAGSITSLSTTVSGHTATLTTYGASINGLFLRHGVVGTINGSTGGYTISGVGRLDGSATFDIEFTANSFKLTDAAIPGGTGNVFHYSTATGAFEFGVPVKVPNGQIANGATFQYWIGDGTTSIDVAVDFRGTGVMEIDAQYNGNEPIFDGQNQYAVRIFDVTAGGSFIANVPVPASYNDIADETVYLPAMTRVVVQPAAGARTYRAQIVKTSGAEPTSISGVRIVVKEFSK